MKKESVWAIVILIIVFIIFSQSGKSSDATAKPYIYGQDPIADAQLATPSTGEQKRQCAIDGEAWYQKNVTDQITPQAIYQANKLAGTNDQSILVRNIYPDNPQFVYSTKLNSCLVDWGDTAEFMNGSTYTTHTITDVYANKSIADWDWGQAVGQSTQDAIKASDATSYNTAEYNLFRQQK